MSNAHNTEADRAAATGGPRAYTLEEIRAMPPAPGMPKSEAHREMRAFARSNAAMLRGINGAE
jgi:hypothetical protein